MLRRRTSPAGWRIDARRRRRIESTAMREHVAEFTPSDYELVAEV
jgi:hypothetical protein